MHVVVLDEGDPALEPGFPRVGVHPLEDLFAGLVARMRLPREHDLHWAPGVDEQPLQPVEIAEDQVGPLVRREAAAEADREGFLIEQGPRAYEVQGDRKSTRLNSSHRTSSYAVFCLKKKRQVLIRRVPSE